MKKLIRGLMTLTVVVGAVLTFATPVGAVVPDQGTGTTTPKTPTTLNSEDPCHGAIIRVNCNGSAGEGIFEVLNIVIDVLTAGVGIAATAGIIVAAFRYTQARDKADSVAGAKKMIIDIVIGLVIWAIFWVVLQWLMPGGRLNSGGGSGFGGSGSSSGSSFEGGGGTSGGGGGRR